MPNIKIESDAHLVLTRDGADPIYMAVTNGLHLGTTRTIESYASAEQAETRMRELVPGWEPEEQENE